MGPQSPRSKQEGSRESSPEEVPSGAGLLDALLRELNEDGLEGSATRAEGDPMPEESPEEASPEPQEGRPSASGLSAFPADRGVAPFEEDSAGEKPTDHLSELSRAVELARAESGSLRAALGLQQSVETDLRRELQEVRSALQETKARLNEASSKFLPAAPVAFLSQDGRTIARRAFYALGRGEALDGYLSELLGRWEKEGRKIVPSYDPRTGITLTLEGDPDRRFLRVLTSGILLVHLNEEEMKAVGELPPLVRAANRSRASTTGAQEGGASGTPPGKDGTSRS